MLESVEIFISLKFQNIRVHDLIVNFTAYNFDSIEFTVHVENTSVRLRLLNSNFNSIYDGSLSVETYSQRITKILNKHNLQYTVIEHLNMDHMISEAQNEGNLN